MALAKISGDQGTGAGVPNRWLFLAVLVLLYSCHSLDRTILFILVEPIRAEFDLSDGDIGLLTGLAYGLSFGLAALPVGFLIDRVDRRRLLGAAAILWSGLTALCGLATSFFWLVFARVGVGGAEASGSPASLSLISDLFPASRRSTAIGILYSSVAIGGVASAVIAGLVITEHGWRAGFIVAGIPGIVLGLFLILALKEPVRGGTDKSTVKPLPMNVKAMFVFARTQPAYLHILFAMTLTVTALASTGVWLSAFLIRYHAMSVAQAATAMAIAFGIFSALGSVGAGGLSDWIGRASAARRVLFSALTMLVVLPLLVLALTLSNLWIVLPLVMLSVALLQGSLIPGFGSALSFVPAGMRGSASALAQLATNSLGAGLGPFLVGTLSDEIGALRPALAGIVAVCTLWAAFHYFRAAQAAGPAIARAEGYVHVVP